jgi:hypothetical protein
LRMVDGSMGNKTKLVGHTRLEPKMRQIRQYKKGGGKCLISNYSDFCI